MGLPRKGCRLPSGRRFPLPALPPHALLPCRRMPRLLRRPSGAASDPRLRSSRPPAPSAPVSAQTGIRGSDHGRITVSPVLLQKGTTRLALYGLGYIRDVRLYRARGHPPADTPFPSPPLPTSHARSAAPPLASPLHATTRRKGLRNAPPPRPAPRPPAAPTFRCSQPQATSSGGARSPPRRAQLRAGSTSSSSTRTAPCEARTRSNSTRTALRTPLRTPLERSTRAPPSGAL